MDAGGKASGHRFAQLDGVRGLAALMVALSHYTLAFQPALLGGGPTVSHFDASVALSHTVFVFLCNPELGVAIFFVLSGFVLAASVTARPASFPELAVRRWVRLSLPILGTSLLAWAMVGLGLFRSVQAAPLAKSDWLGMNYAWTAFEGNALWRVFWQSGVDVYARAVAWYNTALWTMPIEFWGSMGLFAAYCALPRVFVRRGVGILVALIALGLLWKTNYFGFPCGIALFEARRLWTSISAARRLALSPFAAPLGCALLIVGVLLGGNPYFIDLPSHGPYARLFLTLQPWLENPVLLVHRLGAVALVASALLWRPVQWALLVAPVRWLGRVSFMVYLCHVPILCSLVAAGVLWLAPQVGYNAATAILLPAFLVVLGATAELTTRAFDAPAIRWSRMAGQGAAAGLRRLRLRPARRRDAVALSPAEPPSAARP